MASATLAVVEIVPDELLEVFELSGRDEDGGVGGVVAMADVAEFDALVLAREALEREINVRKLWNSTWMPKPPSVSSGSVAASSAAARTSPSWALRVAACSPRFRVGTARPPPPPRRAR